MKPVVVIGIGNPLMSDDGVGITLVNRLRELEDSYPNCEFLDIGSSVHRVLHALVGRGKAILVDCGNMDLEPGAIRRFGRDEVVSRRSDPDLTFHGMDLLYVLDLSEGLGELPKEIVIFAIQPESVSPGQGLSMPLQAKLPEYQEAIEQEL